jgi:predicted GNAT family acetyltransferase
VGHSLGLQREGARQRVERGRCLGEERVVELERLAVVAELELSRSEVERRRSRERLETEIDCFSVVERDGAIIGCAALYADQPNRCAELACVATAPDYRRNGRANRLLGRVEDAGTRAKAENALKQLTAMMAMANMWVNAVISDIAATTVYTFQQTYDWKAFMEYQAAHNVEVAKRLDAMQALIRESDAKATHDCLIRVEQKMGMFLQEIRKLQPDHTKPPKVQ